MVWGLQGYLAHKKPGLTTLVCPNRLRERWALALSIRPHGSSSAASRGLADKNNYFKEMCSGSEEGSHLRLIRLVYHSTLGLGVIKKEEKVGGLFSS